MKSKTIKQLTNICEGIIPVKKDSVLVVFLKIVVIISILAIIILLFPLVFTIITFLVVKDLDFKDKGDKTGVLVLVVIVGFFFSLFYWGKSSDVGRDYSVPPMQTPTVLSEEDEVVIEDISALLAQTEILIKEFNENLVLASSYNIDIEKYKEVTKFQISEDSSYQTIEDIYNQVNENNDELETSINEAKNKTYQVTKVVDGDTIKISYEGIETSVRLIGIDTPETVHPSDPIECFGVEASSKMKSLVEGEEVRIMFDNSQGIKDKYGRLLLYIWVGDIFVNKNMVEKGYAHEYTYSTPYLYQTEFKEVEKEARESESGLWGDVCACEEKEVSSRCSSCKIRTVTYQRWDCSTYIETRNDSSCTSGCTVSVPTPPPVINTTPTYVCDCSKTCPQMSSCAEAQYQLNVCGCTRRDGDKDGIACDADCQ